MPFSDNTELVDVSLVHILICMVPLGLIAFVSYSMGLKLESPILVGTARTFLQLTGLAFILRPIFVWGEEYFEIVVCYALFMILISSYESVSRTNYYFHNMYLYVLACFLANMTAISIFAFGIVIKPQPVWEPQYVIPLLGMLLGNSINSSSLSMRAMLTSLVEESAEINLLLAFGATRTEASSRLVREAFSTGALPVLNSMSVIGLISIPGMMTGQILGGTDVMEAARYQMLIMYLIATANFGTILSEVYFALRVGFEVEKDMLRTDRLVKRDKRRNFVELVGHYCYSSVYRRRLRLHYMRTMSSGESQALRAPEGAVSSYVSPKGELQVSTSQNSTNPIVLEASHLKCSFPVKGSADERNTLFDDLSFQVRQGEMSHVSGPSGTGKSTLLRAVAGLAPLDTGTLKLSGEPLLGNDYPAWRRRIRYVTQYKVTMPGTPIDFIRRISGFRSWRSDESAPSKNELLANCRRLLQNWGMEVSSLAKEWSQLSGGEAQRILVAIALTSKPQVLLMDEITSALDLDTKMRVEKSVQELVCEEGMAVLWITHDTEQADRMRNR